MEERYRIIEIKCGFTTKVICYDLEKDDVLLVKSIPTLGKYNDVARENIYKFLESHGIPRVDVQWGYWMSATEKSDLYYATECANKKLRAIEEIIQKK